jgi:CBS-domain-containing membrane protein
MGWTVADVMTREVVVVGPATEFKDCVNLLRQHSISAVPVVNRDREVIGIVSEHDLLAKEERRGAKRPRIRIPRVWDQVAAGRTAADIMASPAITIRPNASIPEAARLMHKMRVKRLPVVDENGKLVGIASRADLLRTFLRSDEAIRKEIKDQILRHILFIDPKSIGVEVSDGLVRLSGSLETRSLAALLVRLVEGVEGTVGVDSRLAYRLDDTHIRVGLPPRALQLSADERR